MSRIYFIKNEVKKTLYNNIQKYYNIYENITKHNKTWRNKK